MGATGAAAALPGSWQLEATRATRWVRLRRLFVGNEEGVLAAAGTAGGRLAGGSPGQLVRLTLSAFLLGLFKPKCKMDKGLQKQWEGNNNRFKEKNVRYIWVGQQRV